MVQSSCGLNVGDPVQLIDDLKRVGKVTVFTPPVTCAGVTRPWPYVVFPDSPQAKEYHPDSLRICKCATRILKGVSKC